MCIRNLIRWMILVVILLWGIELPTVFGQNSPLRLPVPFNLIAEGTSYYGIYLCENKIGWIETSLDVRIHDHSPVYIEKCHMVIHLLSSGIPAHLIMIEHYEFDYSPPYRFIGAHATTSHGSSTQSVQIFRNKNGFYASINKGGISKKMALGPIDYTMEDATTPEAWFSKERKVGEQLQARSYDIWGLRQDIEVHTITAIKETGTDGINTTYYEGVITTADLEEPVSFFRGRDGRLISEKIGSSLEVRLEPKTIAQKISNVFDIFLKGSAIIDKPLGNPKNITDLVIKVRGQGVDNIPSGPRQIALHGSVKGEVLLKIGKSYRKRTLASQKEVKEATESNLSYPVKDPKIIALKNKAVGDATTPRDKIQCLVDFVDRYIKDSYPARSLTIMDIIEKKEGDCTEHAALFTTLARAAGIPAREVYGLVYLGDAVKAFGGHVWNEVVIDGNWVPVDVIWGEIETDATHIRFTSGLKNLIHADFGLSGFTVEVVSVRRQGG